MSWAATVPTDELCKPMLVNGRVVYILGTYDMPLELCKRMGIGHILTAYKKEREEVKARYRAAKIEWSGFSLKDEPDSILLPLLNKWIRWLNTRQNNSTNSNNAILVHCEAGISRSVSMVIGWMIHSELYCPLQHRSHFPLSSSSSSSISQQSSVPYLIGDDVASWVDAIIGKVQSCRRWAKPNAGFHLQLIDYARHNIRRALGFAFRRSLPRVYRYVSTANILQRVSIYDVLINYLV